MQTTERKANELRQVRVVPDYTEMAAGSVLICCGRTRVICTASVQEGVPSFLKGKGKGWLTAEYAMLPGSTPQRKARDGVKKDGRGVEIQRLIGRSLRAACDLTRLGERTVYIDCDVIQADGGTRTASITGAFVALCLAVDRLLQQGVLVDSPIVRQVAAVSVGVVDDVCTTGFNSLIRSILKRPMKEKQVVYIIWSIGLIFGLIGIIVAYFARGTIV